MVHTGCILTDHVILIFLFKYITKIFASHALHFTRRFCQQHKKNDNNSAKTVVKVEHQNEQEEKSERVMSQVFPELCNKLHMCLLKNNE